MANEYVGDEPFRVETRKTFVKLPQPVKIQLALDKVVVLEILKLIQVVKVDNATGEDVALLHYQTSDYLDMTTDDLKALLDGKVYEQQEEIQKHLDEKIAIDSAVTAEAEKA